MKTKIRDIDRLDDIIEQANFIQEFTNIKEQEFYDNKVLRLAILKSLEIIGEAANQISNETKEENRSIDWREMVSARNFYIHEYFAIEWPLVWKSVKGEIDLDKIKTYCLQISEQLKKELF